MPNPVAEGDQTGVRAYIPLPMCVWVVCVQEKVGMPVVQERLHNVAQHSDEP